MDLFTLTLVSCGLTVFAMGIIIALIVIVIRYGGQGVQGFISGILAPFTGGDKREEQQDERVQRERELGVTSAQALRQRARDLQFAIDPDRANQQQGQFNTQSAPQQYGGQSSQFNAQSAPQQYGGQNSQFNAQNAPQQFAPQSNIDPQRFGARLGNSSPPRATLTPSQNTGYGTQPMPPQQPQQAQQSQGYGMPSLSPSRPYQAGGTGALPPTSMPPQQQPLQGYNPGQQPGYPNSPDAYPGQQQGATPPPINPNQQPFQQRYNPGQPQGFQGNPQQQQGFPNNPQQRQQPSQQGGLEPYRPNIQNVARPGNETGNIGGRPRRDQRQGDEFREVYLDDDGGFGDFF
ncbi:MAG: hypothetical protein KC496_06750 [Anaerolineae bacterium]|nr:hypothetical protein [Anaerolineae bacterium]